MAWLYSWSVHFGVKETSSYMPGHDLREEDISLSFSKPLFLVPFSRIIFERRHTTTISQ